MEAIASRLEATSNKKLLGAPGLTATSKDATNGAPGIATGNKKLVISPPVLILSGPASPPTPSGTPRAPVLGGGGTRPPGSSVGRGAEDFGEPPS